MSELVLLVVVWCACGMLSAGLSNAYKRKQAPERSAVGDLKREIVSELPLGPFGLYVLFKTGQYAIPPSFKDGPVS